jgi:hypothetical protein
MAKNMRSIIVEDRQFRWRFDERLVVIPANRSGPQLCVDWGWRDWLEPDGPGPEPHVVTPRFVAEAIRFALAQGWQPEANGVPLQLGFKNGRFLVVNEQTKQKA